jgi:hypothetical protein
MFGAGIYPSPRTQAPGPRTQVPGPKPQDPSPRTQVLQIHRPGSREHRAQLIAVHHFLVEEVTGHALEDVAVLAQHPARFVERVLDELLDLFVDQARSAGIPTSIKRPRREWS